MLRIAEQWFQSDLGRQRQGNEDNYFVQAPLFVVADGMGGAQAGEVASEMAVKAFQRGLPNGDVEDGLAKTIQAANREIHDRSRADASHQGMGTTCTAAYVEEDEVVLGHVGDSRAYLWRNGELTRLTRDHSLVGELMDRGKLTEEQAELHPQRSVITRALGPEREVEVDTKRVEARGGDLYLLCSDGLTSMIREVGIKPILTEGGSLESLGRALIAAANDAGGRDNITVVLFRLDEVELPAGAEQATVEASSVADDGYEDYGESAAEGGAAGPAGGSMRTSISDEARASDQQEASYRASSTVALSAIRPPAPEPPAAEPPATAPQPAPAKPDRPPRRRRYLVRIGIVGFIVGVLGISAWIAMRAVFFVGVTDDTRTVAIFRGLPYDLPAGIELYTTHYASGVTIEQVPQPRRRTFTDHKLRSLEDARDLVTQLEEGSLQP